MDYDSEYDTPEEREANYQARRNMAKQLEADQQRMAAEDALENQQREQQKIFTDALSEHGLDQETFNKLVAADPDGTKELFKEGLKTYVSKVARRRDPKTGQFLKGPAQQASQPEQPAQPEGFFETGRKPPKLEFSDKRFSDPEVKRAGTDEEVKDMIMDLLGNDPMMDI